MEGSVAASKAGALDESARAEPVPLKNRMAVYQAAVSKQDKTGFSSTVMEDAEVCSLPGGLASIRRQFESEGMSSAHTVTQIHHTHRSVQEVSNSSAMSVASSSGGRQVSQQVFLQDERTAYDQITHNREVISSYENHHNETEEEEYYPRLSAKELAQHFEKTIEEAAPSKKIKIRVPKSEMCAVCKKRVYPMEGLIADKKKFHKSCFFCEHCKNKLSQLHSRHGEFAMNMDGFASGKTERFSSEETDLRDKLDSTKAFLSLCTQ
ncbi:xin actin-binding repeat-containing protein 2-like isoform X3 [Ctenopharyngodon idella]|uniref:xin actin-binding repeat-containing protein 2-like isoform X3 n=1 Tax=Ctenopharyngodon idella TaxID=7959 RepID=UPI00222F76D2|nr:xin actin-binding repeat-containing protein 2-like isoform X3 [Ctenopharyngodon idella]